MKSLILRTTTPFITLLLSVFAVFVLIRGHNEPGGGFIGGLLVAAAMALHMLAFGVAAVRRLLGFDPRTLIGWGLLLALLSGCAALVADRPFMTGLWLSRPVPGIGKVGTVLLFDTAVMMVVIGTALTILLGLAEDAQD